MNLSRPVADSPYGSSSPGPLGPDGAVTAPLDATPLRSPPLMLVTGPAGSGKTEWALGRFCERHGHALLILPSAAQADFCAERIAARPGGRNADEARPAIHTFHTLARFLCGAREQARNIGRTFQRLAVAEVVRGALRADDYFGGMLNAPGFVPALTERLREWKLACLTPDALEAAAEPAAAALGDPTFARKAHELARLYRGYQAFLARGRLYDEEDLLLLAAERARAAHDPPPLHAGLLLVDGFYRLNRAQRSLLAALAGRGLDTGPAEFEIAVTLPYDAARPLLFAAPERALRELRAAFRCQEIALPDRRSQAPASLALLESRLYRGDQAALRAPSRRKSGEPAAQNGAKREAPILLFDAPNPYVEAEMTARAFRRMHDEEGYAWSDFAVVLRTLGDYAPILAAVFERYDVPLGVDGPERLAENPLIKTLSHLLNVIRHGWQRDDVLAFLKSSYTAPDKLAADALRLSARRSGTRAGRGAWLALAGAERTAPTVHETVNEMARFEAELTREGADPEEISASIRDMITAFGLEERIALGEPTRQERDRAALQSAYEVLDGLRDLFTFVAKDTAGRGRNELFSFALFHTELMAAWRTTTTMATPKGDVVHVTEPYDTRDRRVKAAAVMGLTERVFPRRVTEDPFLRDEERAVLGAVAGIDLDLIGRRTDDERFLFYLAVTAPEERLILSYPRASNESDTLPSFYLDEVRGAMEIGDPAQPLLMTLSRTLADVAPRPDETVSHGDRLLAACADLFDPISARSGLKDLEHAASRLLTCAQEAPIPGAVSRILDSRTRPRLPHLEDPALRAAFATHRTVYSVSELETYQRCPFQYLLTHVLVLSPEPDGTDPRAHGSLLHGVLRRYFRRRATPRHRPPEPDPNMRSTLQGLLDEALQAQRLDVSSHRLRMIQRLLTDALNGFVEREERFSALLGMTPTHFELSFGVNVGRAGATGVEDDDRDERLEDESDATRYDTASCAEPLMLMGDEGAPVAVCGVIDRVDLDGAGRNALIIDYKLGRPPEWNAIERGTSLQMPLYLLAMERLFNKVGAAACYDTMRERGRPRFHRMDQVNVRQFGPVIPIEDGKNIKPLNKDQYADLVKKAERTAVRLARAITAGSIEATPGDHCRACAYGDICRTTLAGHDGEKPVIDAPAAADV